MYVHKLSRYEPWSLDTVCVFVSVKGGRKGGRGGGKKKKKKRGRKRGHGRGWKFDRSDL